MVYLYSVGLRRCTKPTSIAFVGVRRGCFDISTVLMTSGCLYDVSKQCPNLTWPVH